MTRVHPLTSQIKDYAWGSRHAIAELRGEPAPSARPQAEMWIGAHPASPSRLAVDGVETGLDAWIGTDPSRILGPEVAARFGGELPFLLKVLAAERPLSIQAHPDAARARAGFARENALGIPLDHPSRCYRDPNHKPELLCALGPFVALAGFRPAGEARSLAGAIGVPDLLAPPAGGAGGDRYARDMLERLLVMDAARRAEIVGAAAGAAGGMQDADPAFGWVASLGRSHPGDAGALAPILLHLVELRGGQALFLPPGLLHAYLVGTGIEIMACSDNVIRGGLTPKHVDAGALMEIASPGPGHPEVLEPERSGPFEWSYRTGAEEFALSEIRLPGRSRHETPAGHGVEILLATLGRPEIACGHGEPLAMDRGSSVLVEASAGPYVIAGDGDRAVWRARVPLPPPAGGGSRP